MFRRQMKNEEINVEEIMKTIRENASKRKFPRDILSFEDVRIIEASTPEDIRQLRNGRKQKNISPSKPSGQEEESGQLSALWEQKMDSLEGSCLIDIRYPIIDGGIKGFSKKAFRRLFRNVIFPLVDQQNEVNRRFVDAFRSLKVAADKSYVNKTDISQLALQLIDSGHIIPRKEVEKVFEIQEQMIEKLQSENIELRMRLESLERELQQQ